MDKPFEVISQERTTARLPDNTFGPVVRVVFRTRGGVVLAVDVPESAYNVDTVRAAIEARAEHADAVQNL